MSEEIKRFTFRIPSDLYEKIEAIAKKNRRSVNSEIVIMLEDFYQTKQTAHKEQTKQENE